MAEPKAKGLKIRYATPEGGEGIEYFGASLLTPGSRELWRDSSDNPMSPAFQSLESRPERAKARWWALYGKRVKNQPAAGVFDPS